MKNPRKTNLERSAPRGGARKRAIPFAFVLDELHAREPIVRPMFGCHSIYVGGRIVLILREKQGFPEDNGVWIATTREHHESLRRDFPSMRSIGLLGKGVTGWQNLPASSPEFESSVIRVCELVTRGDPRIGKFPGTKSKKSGATTKRKRI